MKHSNHITCIALITLACSPALFAANCTLESGVGQSLNFGSSLATQGLTIPADTPDGTVVYQETLQLPQHTWTCSSAYQYGVVINPALGAVTSGSTFPLGKTGLSFRIWMEVYARYEPAPYTLKAAKYSNATSAIRLEIVKSGTLAPQVKIAAGNLANQEAGDLILTRYNLINPLVLTAASCQSPSVHVAMGDDYQLHEFRNTGSTPRTVRFDIGLNQCQAGINKVTYTLKATTPVLDTQKGIVALNASSTASGIGLQVMNDAGQPIVFDSPYTFGGFTTTGTSFNIPLSAAYYRLPTGDLKAGSANTEITFIMSYL